VFGRKKKSLVRAEKVLILHQQGNLSPDQVRQLVQAYTADIDGADLNSADSITEYNVREPTRDLALALVARLEGEGKLSANALERASTKPFQTTGGPIIVAGVWREKPTLRHKHPAFGLSTGMNRASVLDRLGPPTRSTTMGEVLAKFDTVAVVGTPPSDTEAWLYVDTPPGHETRVTITGGQLQSAEIYVQSSGKSKLIWSTDGGRRY
jgi:hypothetical protein